VVLLKSQNFSLSEAGIEGVELMNQGVESLLNKPAIRREGRENRFGTNLLTFIVKTDKQ
jgi:hypothetical protein